MGDDETVILTDEDKQKILEPQDDTEPEQDEESDKKSQIERAYAPYCPVILNFPGKGVNGPR